MPPGSRVSTFDVREYHLIYGGAIYRNCYFTPPIFIQPRVGFAYYHGYAALKNYPYGSEHATRDAMTGEVGMSIGIRNSQLTTMAIKPTFTLSKRKPLYSLTFGVVWGKAL